MIKSQYILDIFNLAFDDHPESDLLREQIPFLTLTDTEHTGIGAFIHFSKDPAIVQFRLNTSNAINFDTEGIPTELLDGIEIRNPELSLLADAMVWLKNGFIDHLEIFNKCGEDYFQEEPEHYHLEQMWLKDKKGRTIIR